MKKIFSAVLAFLMLFTCLTPAVDAAQSSPGQQAAPIELNMTNFSKAAGFDFNFESATSIWQNIIGSEQPARLPCTYTLNSNVQLVGDTFDANIKSPGQILAGGATANKSAMDTVADGAYINKDILQAVVGQQKVIQPGEVFFNQQTGTAFKVVAPIDGGEATAPYVDNYAVTQPQINEIVSDLQIPATTVTLNKANISSFAALPGSAGLTMESYIVQPGQMQVMSTSDPYTSFKYLQDPLIKFQFPVGTELTGSLGEGQEVTVKINGGLAIGDLGLDAEYSGFDGFEFALQVSQESYLSVDVGINISQEIRIPILGIEVPFGVGSAGGGLYLIVGMDGQVTIQIRAREFITCRMGLCGDTFLYVPVSIRPLFELPERKFDGDVDVDGRINGYVKAGAMVHLEIFGWDLAGAGVFIGVGVNITSDDSMLDIELYGLIQVYVTFAGDTYNLIYARPTILRKRQKDMGGYRATIEESCAYQDLVAGYLQTSQKDGGNIVLAAAPNTDFQVVIIGAVDGVTTTYPLDNSYYQTDLFGRFLVHDFDINYNDQVGIQVVAGGQTYGPSIPILATYPFSRIEITAADPFNDWIEGQVDPVRVRNWDQQDGEEEYEMLHFQGAVQLQIQKGHQYNILRDTLYSVHVTTDEDGNFRAENGSLQAGDPTLDLKSWHLLSAVIDDDNALVCTESHIVPRTQFLIRTVEEPVPGSAVRFMEGGKTIDQQKVNVRTYIINTGGSKQLTDIYVDCNYMGFSTQDWLRRMAYAAVFDTGTSGINYAEMLSSLFPSKRTFQLMSDPPVTTAGGETYGTSYFDTTIVREWVWQAHSNPTVITSADHYECTTNGGNFQVTATGVPPIIYGIRDAPAGVSIATDSGAMIIDQTVLPGVYPFIIRVTADASMHITLPFPGDYPSYVEDIYPPVEQTFTLTVTPGTVSPTPVLGDPAITSPATGELTPQGGTFQVTAAGTAPITFSISGVSSTVPLPERITIDAQTGLMTVGGDRPLGEYDFLINAHNSVGDAQQLFHLLIVRTISPTTATTSSVKISPFSLSRNPLRITSMSLPDILPNTSGNSGLTVQHITNATSSTVTLRNDDPEDFYTTDMLTVFGANYVKWDLLIRFTADETPYQLTQIDKSPLNDHHLTHLTDAQKKAIQAKMQEQLTKYNEYSFGPDDSTGLGDWDLENIFGSTVFDYGSVIDMIKGSVGGGVSLDLTDFTGTVIPGKIFNALKEITGADVGLTLRQTAAQITFQSKTIGSVTVDQLYDFAFSAQTDSETVMKQAAGSGATSFTYAFAHNGSLPGYAQFAISTDLAAGTEVNVYKYDAAALQFALVAGGIEVAENGVVTYMNNTTSEYLITTATLNGAVLTDAYSLYNNPADKPFNWLIVLLIGNALLIIGGVTALILINRKRTRQAKSL